jgi:hypothetical protein
VPIPHGTAARYDQGCRCGPCIDAGVAPHGTRERYNHRSEPCRCDRCRAANAAYNRERNAEIRRAAMPAGTYELVDDQGDVVGVQAPLFET